MYGAPSTFLNVTIHGTPVGPPETKLPCAVQHHVVRSVKRLNVGDGLQRRAGSRLPMLCRIVELAAYLIDQLGVVRPVDRRSILRDAFIPCGV